MSTLEYGLGSVCTARELITAFGLYSSLSGQTVAESFITLTAGDTPATPPFVIIDKMSCCTNLSLHFVHDSCNYQMRACQQSLA